MKLPDMTQEKLKSSKNEEEVGTVRELSQQEKEPCSEMKHNVKIRFGFMDLFKIETQSIVIPDYDGVSRNSEHTVFSQFMTKLDQDMANAFSEERRTDSYLNSMRRNFAPFFSKVTMSSGSAGKLVPLASNPQTILFQYLFLSPHR